MGGGLQCRLQEICRPWKTGKIWIFGSRKLLQKERKFCIKISVVPRQWTMKTKLKISSSRSLGIILFYFLYFKMIIKSFYFELCFNKSLTMYTKRSLKHLKIFCISVVYHQELINGDIWFLSRFLRRKYCMRQHWREMKD